jgi:hypothetical protein
LRVSVLWLAVIGLIAGAVAFKATSDVNSAFVDAVHGLSDRIADRLASVETALCGTSNPTSDVRPPGRVWVLVAGGNTVVGLDRDGRVTQCDTACPTGGLPVLTGFVPVESEPGMRLRTPEVVLGLTIVRAFELSPATARVLSEVDLADFEHPRAILSGGLTAELGHGSYSAKVTKLGQVLLQARELNMHLKRIDLRFGCQVIVDWDPARRGFDKEV